MFAVRYVGDPDELDGETEHPIACRVFAPGGSQMGEQTASLKASAIPIVPGYVAEMTIPTALVLEMREYGTHRIEFSIDGNSVDVPMHCIKELP